MGDRYYILQEGKPVPAANIHIWGYWYETSKDERIVARTEIGDVRVSTVFLGLDHGWEDEVLLYETMIFGGPHDQDQDRYTTRQQAEEGHHRMVALVEASATTPQQHDDDAAASSSSEREDG